MNQRYYRGEIMDRILTDEEKRDIESRYQKAKHYTGNSENVGRNLKTVYTGAMAWQRARKHAGKWHLPDCEFPDKDQAVCNCPDDLGEECDCNHDPDNPCPASCICKCHEWPATKECDCDETCKRANCICRCHDLEEARDGYHELAERFLNEWEQFKANLKKAAETYRKDSKGNKGDSRGRLQTKINNKTQAIIIERIIQCLPEHEWIGDGGMYTMCKNCECFPSPQGGNKKCGKKCEKSTKQEDSGQVRGEGQCEHKGINPADPLKWCRDCETYQDETQAEKIARLQSRLDTATEALKGILTYYGTDEDKHLASYLACSALKTIKENKDV